MYDLASMIAEENLKIGIERGLRIAEEEEAKNTGKTIGIILGRYKKAKEVSLKLYAKNEPIEYIAYIVGSTVDQVKEWIEHPDYDDIDKLRHDLLVRNQISQ
ncbi:MAG: hypothetical protein ACI4WM_03905 [Erysipelotrichaceae bacterium]